MLYVINDDHGSFDCPDEVWDEVKKNYDTTAKDFDIRANKILIDWVRTHKDVYNYDDNEDDDYNLNVVEIPDNATDWEISEYDGLEEIIAVVDGKIIHIY